MNVTLKEIDKSDIAIFSKLMQLYLHEISLYFPMKFDSKTGLYTYQDFDKYIKDNNQYKAFLIKNDSEITGLILIYLSEEKNIIQEMFILNNYKRKGMGKIAATMIFDKFKGDWEIKALPNSITAEKFWNCVIKDYTKNKFNLEYVGMYNRAIFTFNNKN